MSVRASIAAEVLDRRNRGTEDERGDRLLAGNVSIGLRMRRRHQKGVRQQKQRAAGYRTERSLMVVVLVEQ